MAEAMKQTVATMLKGIERLEFHPKPVTCS